MNETMGSGSKIERLFALAAVLAAGFGAAAVWYFEPTTAGLFPACPLFTLTGFACPGCGLTRGFHELFRGNVLTALDYNALLPLFALFLGYLLVALLVFAYRGRGLPIQKLNGPMLVSLLALLLVFGVARNVPVYPFTVLFP